MIDNDKIKLIRTDDGSTTLFNESLKETYHSLRGAKSESLHVFIENGLHYYLNNNRIRSLRIFEVGFGTGLNALLTFLYLQQNPLNCFYHAIDTFPLTEKIASKLDFGEENKQNYRNIISSVWNSNLKIGLDFILRKDEIPLETITLKTNSYDIIYYDAFAPSKQPEIWSLSNLRKCYSSLKEGGILVTYCAQGQFKRNLATIGFEVEVLQGALGKKEMVRATKNKKTIKKLTQSPHVPQIE